ncbi:three-Cys-motif partner protein TcmP [Streptomyces sp. NBC_01016]|uniref:three-Cys-motif partner protein TcmP n=1 Tax=Streptomyces sp. NBC_01016 TaxID=2903720 RepID=UPI00225B6365|nr:three-Cys-motif partner protein TcmP [Streptomyces sp. NBC_01016]MCX4834328.1 three-Cys-motif partner protein TcmP [Streptomyces sp. NBC_01016]
MGRVEELRDQTVWKSDPHTQVKHLVYRHYLQCWMAKILQTFPEATIVDAFSGPGVYSDGPAGSSIVVAKTFLEHTAHRRFGRLNLICLEERPDRVEELQRQFTELPQSPQLKVSIQPPGAFAEQQARLASLAHLGRPETPVLWLIDPFDLKSAPFTSIRQCLGGPRDEVLFTLFTNELHRFCQRDGFDKTMTGYFGGTHWQTAIAERRAGTRKEAFAAAYQQGLQDLGLFTGGFGIKISNQSARYHLILATHSEAGLKCWAPVTWKLDSYSGQGASADTADAPSLFDEASVVDRLDVALRAHAGTEQRWETLSSEAARLNHMDKHLRKVLDHLAAQGLAIRVDPVKARTAWPEGSTVRFYAPDDVADEAS